MCAKWYGRRHLVLGGGLGYLQQVKHPGFDDRLSAAAHPQFATDGIGVLLDSAYTEYTKRWAIWQLDAPYISSPSTSRSRGVSGSISELGSA